MLQHKDKIILSEIKGFFTSSEKAMETIFSFISSLIFLDKKYGFSEADINPAVCYRYFMKRHIVFLHVQNTSLLCFDLIGA